MKLNLEQLDSLVAILLLLLHSKNPLDLTLVVAVCVGMRRHIAPRDTDSLALLPPYPQNVANNPKEKLLVYRKTPISHKHKSNDQRRGFCCSLFRVQWKKT
jgi:hypothetical protein